MSSTNTSVSAEGGTGSRSLDSVEYQRAPLEELHSADGVVDSDAVHSSCTHRSQQSVGVTLSATGSPARRVGAEIDVRDAASRARLSRANRWIR